jgi:hypothetical protein
MTQEEFEQNLRRIIIPEVDFRDAALLDIVEWLSLQSRGLIEGNAFGAAYGVPILLILPEGSSTAQTRITWKAVNVSLGSAILEVAQAAGLTMQFNPSGVFLCPPHIAEAIASCVAHPPESMMEASLPVIHLPDWQGPEGIALN